MLLAHQPPRRRQLDGLALIVKLRIEEPVRGVHHRTPTLVKQLTLLGANGGDACPAFLVDQCRARFRQNSIASIPRSKAEINIIVVHRKPRIKPAQFVPYAASHRHARSGDGSHLPSHPKQRAVGRFDLETAHVSCKMPSSYPHSRVLNRADRIQQQRSDDPHIGPSIHHGCEPDQECCASLRKSRILTAWKQELK